MSSTRCESGKPPTGLGKPRGTTVPHRIARKPRPAYSQTHATRSVCPSQAVSCPPLAVEQRPLPNPCSPGESRGEKGAPAGTAAGEVLVHSRVVREGIRDSWRSPGGRPGLTKAPAVHFTLSAPLTCQGTSTSPGTREGVGQWAWGPARLCSASCGQSHSDPKWSLR